MEMLTICGFSRSLPYRFMTRIRSAEDVMGYQRNLL